MSMTSVRCAIVVCVAILTLTASQSARAAAQVVEEVTEAKATAPTAVKSDRLNGKLEATDLKAKTITIQHKQEHKTFTVAPDCEVIGAADKKVTLADLVIGERVKVKYTQEGGKLVAQQISHVDKKKK